MTNSRPYLLIAVLLALIAVSPARAADAPNAEEVSAAKGAESESKSEGDSEEESDDDFDDEFDDEYGDEEEKAAKIADPLYYWNYSMYVANDKLYFWVLKPVAKGYGKVLPEPCRVGVRNFFTNVSMPIRLVNCTLQGKFGSAWDEFCIFAVNTTEGVLGFRDTAKKKYGMKRQEEDFGQTLGKYGLGHGCYLVWPFFGPSSPRDTVGLIGDSFLNPPNYLPLIPKVGVKATEKVNGASLRIGDYEQLKESAINPYESIRDIYVQLRRKQVSE